MLSFIFGRSGSGKTHSLYGRIKQRAEKGVSSLLLVPEQFTSGVELDLLRRFDDSLCHYITVADFGRITRMVHTMYGDAMPTVGDAYRVALCRQAVSALKGQLKYYTAERYSNGFFALCADIIKELKMSCSSQELREIADSDKLRDIALIYQCYDELLSGRREPQDSLLACAQIIEDNADFLVNTAIFIDGFHGFTAPEYSLLSALLTDERDMTITMCMPFEQVSEEDFFSTVHTTAKRLMRIAQKRNVKLDLPHTVLFENKRNEGDLECLNLLLCGQPVELPDELNDVTITPYDDIAEETFALASSIHAQVMAGDRYQDIAVVMRNSETYYGELMRCFDLFNIPAYIDMPNELRFCAPARVVYSLLSLRSSLNTDDILTLIGTGLCDLSQEETAALQDWILRFYPSAKDWREGVSMSADDESKSWFRGNEVRARMMDMLSALFDRESSITQSIYATMVRLKIEKSIEGEELTRQYNLIISILDQLHSLNEQWENDTTQLQHLYTILLQNTKFHDIPRVKDSIGIYEPDRIAGYGIKTLYMLGVNSSVFPAEVGASGLLNHTDRESLAGHDLLLPGLYVNRVMLEDLYLYLAVCTPSEQLHISYTTKNAGKLSYALLPILPHVSPRQTGEFDAVATPKSAAVVLSRYIYGERQAAAFLEQTLHQSGHQKLAKSIGTAKELPCFDVNERKNIDILLRDLSLSAGKISGYKLCGFSFFMQHLMKIEPVRRLELSADIAGTFIHGIMERILREYPELTTVSTIRLAELCENYSKEIIAQLFSGELSVKDLFIVKRLSQSALQLILFLQREQTTGKFRPEQFELWLERQIETPCGVTLKLRGVVDRIDSCVIDGERYIRVVDYKTGSKEFSMRDLLDGIDIQLFLYMFYVSGSDETPAGAFYLSSKPTRTGNRSTYKYDGAALAEPSVLEAMGSEYLSLKQKANGEYSSSGENRMFDRAKAARIKNHIDELIKNVASEMNDGRFDCVPFVSSGKNRACGYCGYRIICRHSDADGKEKVGSTVEYPFSDDIVEPLRNSNKDGVGKISFNKAED